ncbi:MAG TPA: YihY/virulence factor BrkB family protein [Reyranella sp.]|jgi:membrane protein|nr:YihY/virulence factor BrkB family protein [Reyranella sp.]
MKAFLVHLEQLGRDAVESFIADNALSRGASIAYYSIFSIAPVLLVAVAMAGAIFGRDAAQGAIVAELSGLMGRDTAKAIQAMIESASNPRGSTLATVIGLAALFVTVTGVFSEIQSALNAIWKAESHAPLLSRLARARLASLGLVATSGFLLTVSLAVSAALASLSTWLKFLYPGADVVLHLVDIATSAVLIAGMFAAIYKVLPDTTVHWRDVAFGAVVTMLLFEAGKYVIALYIGQSKIASSYGAAGALIVLLVWIYYSAQIFLLGAEFTHAFARRFGSQAAQRKRAEPT